jgi:hypothetical protein
MRRDVNLGNAVDPGLTRRWRRTALTRRAIGVAACHPLSVRRFAPAIKWLQRAVVHVSTVARPPAADPLGVPRAGRL